MVVSTKRRSFGLLLLSSVSPRHEWRFPENAAISALPTPGPVADAKSAQRHYIY